MTPLASQTSVDIPVNALPGVFGSFHITPDGGAPTTISAAMVTPDGTPFDTTAFAQPRLSGFHCDPSTSRARMRRALLPCILPAVDPKIRRRHFTGRALPTDR